MKITSLRRFQFRLRSLTILMLVVALAAGIVGWLRNRSLFRKRQQEAVAILSGRFGHSISSEATELKLPWGVTPEALQYLPYFTNLRSLSISGNRLTGDSLSFLVRMPNLKSLDLHSCQLSPDDVILFDQLQNLDRLSLIGTPISASAVAEIAKLENLKALEIEFEPRPYEQFLEGPRGIDRLVNLTALESLRIGPGSCIRFGDLTCLRSMPNLRKFWLQSSVHGNALADLQYVPQLTELRLQSNQLSDKDLQYIVGMKQLKHLTLESNSGNSVTSKGIKYLEQLIELEYLNLNRCSKLDAESLDSLQLLKKLKTFKVCGPLITKANLESLCSKLPNLKKAYWNYQRIEIPK